MMKSHFDENKRPYSVVPMRAFSDKQLKERELRVLGALCAFVNRAGVCWPSMETLCNVSGYAERKSVHEAMKRLKSGKYVRQLHSKDYQKAESGWKTNRYQVLWDGDEPLPTYEEIHIAKPLQLRSDQDDDHIEEKGSLRGAGQYAHARALADESGQNLTEIQLTAASLCNAFISNVMSATGQVRLYDNEIAHARKLALRDVTVDDVKAATLLVCDKAIQRRGGVPSMADVVRHFDEQGDKPTFASVQPTDTGG